MLRVAAPSCSITALASLLSEVVAALVHHLTATIIKLRIVRAKHVIAVRRRQVWDLIRSHAERLLRHSVGRRGRRDE